MDLEGSIRRICECPHDHDALSAAASPEVVQALLDAAKGSYDEERAGTLLDALGRVAWLFVESARRDFRPAVLKKGKVITPASDGPLDARYRDVVLGQLHLHAEHLERGDDPQPQAAFNTAVRALIHLPIEEVAAAATRIFREHGERTAEPLSLDEAYFCFPSNTPLPPIAATLRSALSALTEERGWAAPW